MMCKDVIANFTDILFEFDDKRAYRVSPQNYLLDVKTIDDKDQKEYNDCSILIQRNNIKGMNNEYILGTSFLYGYYQVYDFATQSIGFNGEYVDFDPHRRIDPVIPEDTSISGWLVFLIIAVVAIVLAGIGLFIYKRYKNKKLREQLNGEENLGLM